MSKLIHSDKSERVRLSSTSIEYGDYAWNPYTGCLHGIDVCPVSSHCWARSITKRFKNHYPNGFEPTVYPNALMSPLHLKKPSRILVSFMGDLFGDWVNPVFPVSQLLRRIRFVVQESPQHTFVFLTKNPKGLVKWSPFPDNAWPGVSVCNQKMFDKALIYLSDVEAKHKWLSFEPLLEKVVIQPGDLEGISWVVIGARSSPVKYPDIDWLQHILVAAHNATGRDFPVWIKDNLSPLVEQKWPGWKILQERPF